ncbi:zinc ABC transporter substrate-binding protein [Gorillibacterium sp. CAU 1737]|uniref:metal ABC transporter solute-binding protein, Zn/Mn family n=1 Tax=Gorillibacterium sp. CAU 1737 TaxID=3140362 RepID=UPI003261519C
MKKRFRTSRFLAGAVALLATGLLLAACGEQEQATGTAPEGSKLRIVTTIAQIAEPLSVIGGDQVQVESLMGAGVDPHLYNATQGDIRKLEESDMIFYSGLHLEANLIRAFEEIGKTKPTLGIGETVPVDQLLKDEEGNVDPHIWFDIDLWKQGLSAATEKLKELSKEHADYFEANKVKYFAQLDALKKKSIDKIGEIPQDKRVLITAHDAFRYFGRMLNLKVIGLQGLSTEDEVGLTDIEDTVKLLMEHKVPAVFVESSINPASIQAVIEGAKKQGLDVKQGGELFSDAMGAAGTSEGTYQGMYSHNVETIYHALIGGE